MKKLVGRTVETSKKWYAKASNLALLAIATVCTFSVGVLPASAEPTIDDVYAAMDFTGISGKLIPAAILLVGIGLIAVAIVIIGKYNNRAKFMG